MGNNNWIAIIGAAAWIPQILSWIYRLTTKPIVNLYLHEIPEVGFTSSGPIFNVNFALLCEKKDLVLNGIKVKIQHEHGEEHVFDWQGISEDLSRVENPDGSSSSIKRHHYHS